MTKKIDKLLTNVDGIARNFQKFEVELAANQGGHQRFEKRFIKIEKRLDLLEKAVGV